VKKKLIYVDQLVGPTSLDIINALTHHYDVHLYYGGIIKTYAEIDCSVKLYKSVPYNKKSFLKRFVSWFGFYITTLPQILFKRNKHVLFLVSNPPLNFLVGYVFHKLTGVRFSLLLWDIYPDIVIQSKYVSKDSIIARGWARLNTKCFPAAKQIFTVSENLSREIMKYGNHSLPNVRIIPNWVNSDEIKPIPRSENVFIRERKLENSFVVMYSGNMGKTHDIESIVETARLLREKPEIRFIMVGDGEKRIKIERAIAEGNLHNVLLLPFQSPEMFKSSIAAAHIGFVTLSEGFENYSVPSKTYYLMAAGCIIFAIAGAQSEMEVIVNRFQCGYRFEPGRARAIADQIIKLYQDHGLQKTISTNARNAAKKFTSENANIIANEVFTS
jgi:glycosyltransferase involved in cell wall biosynthesis